MRKAMVFLMGIIFLSGCASMYAPSSDTITINTVPPGAEVYDGVTLLGTTPLTHTFKRDTFEHKKLSIRKEKYKTHEFKLGRTLEKVALFNFGFITTTWGATSWGIDALNGNMIRYDPDSYLIDLESAGSGTESGSSLERRNRLRFVLMNYDSLRSDLARSDGDYLLAYHRLRNSRDDYQTFLGSVLSESSVLLAQEDAVALFQSMESLLW